MALKKFLTHPRKSVTVVTMRLITLKTLFEVLAGILENLTSGWFGLLIVAPGLFDVSSFEEYMRLLTINLPLGIVGLIATLLLKERSKRLSTLKTFSPVLQLSIVF